MECTAEVTIAATPVGGSSATATSYKRPWTKPLRGSIAAPRVALVALGLVCQSATFKRSAIAPAADENLSDQQIAEELASIGWVLASMLERGEVQLTPSLVESVRGLVNETRGLAVLVGLVPVPVSLPALLPGV